MIPTRRPSQRQDDYRAGKTLRKQKSSTSWTHLGRVFLALCMMAAGSLLVFSLTPSLYPKLKARIRAVPALRIQKHAVLDGDAANSSVIVSGLPSVPARAAAVTPSAGEEGSLTDRVRAALSKVGFKANTDQQQMEWNKGLISFHAGKNETCSALCKSKHSRCARDWFLFIDVCAVAQKAFPGLRCAELSVASVPMAVRERGELFISRDSRADPPTCEAAPSTGGERLCPCVPVSKEHTRPSPPTNGDTSVADVVKELLTEADAADRVALTRATAQGTKHQVELEPDGTQVSSRLLADISANRVTFFKGDRSESCEATCKAASLKCAPRWFKTLNRCEVMLAAFPQTPEGIYLKSCKSDYYGHDLPGYQTDMKQILLNNGFMGGGIGGGGGGAGDVDTFPTTCGGRGDFTRRVCPCSYRYPNTKTTYHTVFNVQSKQYFEWQSRYSVYWHKQVGQAGPITRLLSMGGHWPTDPTPHPTGDHLMQEVPTHVAPQYDYSIDSYTAYNKPLSITHWLQTTQVKEDVIIVADPDCAYINKVDIAVEEGAPVATQGYYTFKSKTSIEYQIAQHYCKGICKHYDPIAVPVIIHRNDLARIAPLWLKYTEDIRRDREGPNKWPIEWNDNRFTVNRIEWVAEMFGYVLAAAHLDLRHEMMDLQLVPSVHQHLTPGVPFLHYHVRIETADHKFWNKGDDHAGENFPWPPKSGTDPVTTRLLQALHDAHTAIGETNRTREKRWDNYYSEWDNPNHETD